MIPLPALSFSCVSNRVSHSARSKILTAYRAGLSRRRSFRISCIGSSAGPARFPAGPRRAANVFGSLSFGTRRCNISGSTGPQGRMSRRQDRSSVFPYSFPRSYCQHAVLFRSTRKRQPDKSCLFSMSKDRPCTGRPFISIVLSSLFIGVSYHPPRFRYSPHLPALYLWIAPSFQPKRMVPTSIPLCPSHFTQSPILVQYLCLFLNVYMHTSTPSDTTSRTRKKPPPREALFISF